MLESLVQWVAGLSTGGRFLWVLIVMALFWIAEGYYSFVVLSYRKWEHARTNLVLLAFVMLINAVFGLATAGVFVWLDHSEFGLLHLLSFPLWADLILSFLVLDLIAQYGAHYALHKVPALWRLHIVHHSDTHVDVTTGTRHHPLDFLFRELAALIAVVLLGMPLAFYLLYRVVTVFFTYWTHANLRLPPKLDKLIGFVFVTPGMHKVHHHHTMPHTDTNFGNMFSIWDRLFGTYEVMDPKDLIYGVDVADYREANNLRYQLGAPWNKKVGKGLGHMRERMD